MKYYSILLTIALLGMVSCSQYPSDYPWGAELNGIRTRLIPSKKAFTLGEPITFNLEMTNVGRSALKYDPQGMKVNDKMLIKDFNGHIIKYIDTDYQTMSPFRLPVIKPGESVYLLYNFDIMVSYHICKPGKYTVQFKGKDRAFGEMEFPASGTAQIEVIDGELIQNDFQLLRCRLIHIIPDDWGMYMTNGFGVHQELVKLHKQGGIVEKCFIMLLPPQKGIVHNMMVWHTKTPMDISKIKHDGKSAFSTSVAEYLGQDQRGYAYWEYTPKALELWPQAKEDILKALEIKTK
ncbi:MAG: hypothetical protein AB1599_05265 [Planctomycetota bacterium]